jgi:hypothetical protein
MAMLDRRRRQWMEPRVDAARRFEDALQHALARTVFGGGCDAWYTNAKDQNFTLWPWSTVRYYASLHQPLAHEFVFAPQTEEAPKGLPST